MSNEIRPRRPCGERFFGHPFSLGGHHSNHFRPPIQKMGPLTVIRDSFHKKARRGENKLRSAARPYYYYNLNSDFFVLRMLNLLHPILRWEKNNLSKLFYQ